MTLLYDRRCVPERAVHPISWAVKEFVLIESLVGQGQYNALGHWSLRG